MRRTMMFGLACMALVSVAYVQTRDDFTGGFSLPWSWVVPGNTPVNTINPPNFSFTSDALQITMEDGSLWTIANNMRNLPNLRVVSAFPGWYIELQFRTNWNNYVVSEGQDPGVYTQVGLVIFTDADNYYQLLVTRAPTENGRQINGSSQLEKNGRFEWAWRVTEFMPASVASNQWIGLRIEHQPESQTILLKYKRPGETDWRPFDGFCTSGTSGGTPGSFGAYNLNDWGCEEERNWSAWCEGNPDCTWGDPQLKPYWHITNLLATPGVRIGLYVNNAGGSWWNGNVFEFDYFETNIVVARPADVDANGCVDDADLLAVLFAFGSSDIGADVNEDGIVDDADLLAVLFDFGSGC